MSDNGSNNDTTVYNITSASYPALPSGPSADGGLAAPEAQSPPIDGVPAGVLDFLNTAFTGDAAAAETAKTVLRRGPEQIDVIVGEAIPTRKPRVAILDWLGDDTGSMLRDDEHGRPTQNFFRLMMAAYDKMIEMLKAEIQHDVVETLVGASLLGHGTIHGYTTLNKVPSLANYQTPWADETKWMRRFTQQLTALSVKIGYYLEQGREVTGVAVLATDGGDNEFWQLLQDGNRAEYNRQREMRKHELTTMVKSLSAAGNFSLAAAYMGPLLVPGQPGYKAARHDAVLTRQDMLMGDLPSATQTELLEDMFLQLEFPQDMIFMPGADMRRLVEVMVAISRGMVAHSQGLKPQGNRDMVLKRY
jgi:hypothetical protein